MKDQLLALVAHMSNSPSDLSRETGKAFRASFGAWPFAAHKRRSCDGILAREDIKAIWILRLAAARATGTGTGKGRDNH